jgi:hypothetical protein
MKRLVGTSLLAAANVAVYATDSLAFLWPVMPLVDAGVFVGFRRGVKAG